MANYPIGRLIAEMRTRHGLSQEQLAGEICSVSTISKIENGAQMPTRKVYEALLQRLGLASRSCTAYVSDEDMHRCILETQIEELIADRCYDEAGKALAEYAACRSEESADIEAMLNRWLETEDGLSVLEIQYAIYQLAVLAREQKEDVKKALALHLKAARMTIPGFSLEDIPKPKLLMHQEMNIMYRIAMLLYETGEQRQAKEILLYLKDYMETRPVDPQEKALIYPRILHVLACWMSREGWCDQQLMLCESGISVCARQMKGYALPDLLEEKGFALAARRQRKEAASILKQAYFVFLAIGASAKAERLRKKARGLFQMDIMASGDTDGMN